MLKRDLTELPRVASPRMEDGHTIDRRRGRRRPVVMPVEIRTIRRALDGSSHRVELHGRTSNVSDDGMLLSADRPLKPRSRCSIVLSGPGTDDLPHRIVGTVRWCHFDFSTWLVAVEIERARSIAA